MAKPETRRAIVIGGSMSGLLSALLLRRVGWDVAIYERVEGELSGRGAGIVAQQQLLARLRELKSPAEEREVVIDHRLDGW